MPLLVNPFKRAPSEAEDRNIDPPIAEVRDVEPSLSTHRLVALRLSGGGMAYRLHLFEDVEAASTFAEENLWPTSQGGAVIAFWALHHRPEVADSADPPEAVVIIRDPQRPEIIQMYSFVDMESAQGFVRDEFRNGIDVGLVSVFWTLSVDLSSANQAEAQEAPDRTYFAMPTLTRTASAVPAELRQQSAVKVATPPSVKEAPKEPEEDPETAEPAEKEPTLVSSIRNRAAAGMERIKTWPGWDGLAPRLMEAVFLKEETYEEAYRDPHATGRARLIVAVGIIAAALGASRAGIDSVALHLVAATVGWAAYAGAIYGFGQLAFGARTGPMPWKQLIQTLGLASAPMSLFLFAIIPTYGPIPVLAAFFWMFLTTVHAISPPLGIDRQSAVVTAAVGSLTFFAIARV
ncbi:MAG: Yip1 family protein, partial [Dehalococcoidia bacterium]